MSSSYPSAASSAPTLRQHQRTPAALKWLLNERAAITGEHEPLQKRTPQLTARIQRWESILLRMRSELAAREARFVQTSQLMATLDVTVTGAHPEASPAASGSVIRQIHLDSDESYGMPLVSAELIERGVCISRQSVARLMRER